MYVHLFNGVVNPSDPREDWREEGPIFERVPYVQCTYGETLFIGELFVHLYNGHIFYKGLYYGDWVVCNDLDLTSNATRITHYKELLESDFEPPKPI